MGAPDTRSLGLAERLLSGLILCALGALAFFLFWCSPRNRDLEHRTASVPLPADNSSIEPPAPSTTLLQGITPPGFQPSTPVETFSPETAFEKIDGKVEFYGPLGLRSLQCQRFVSLTNASETFELFLYELAGSDGAFSAFTLQRRDNAQTSDIAAFAYSSENLFALMHGRHYLELIASSTSATTMAAMEATAQRFASAHPTDVGAPTEATWFPSENLKPETIALTVGNGFGFEGFSRLFTANYRGPNSDIQVFFMPTGSPEAALKLFTDYCSFLIDNGAVFESDLDDIPGGRAYNVFGTYELVFSLSGAIGGVHQAEDLLNARHAAKNLYSELLKRQQTK